MMLLLAFVAALLGQSARVAAQARSASPLAVEQPHQRCAACARQWGQLFRLALRPRMPDRTAAPPPADVRALTVYLSAFDTAASRWSRRVANLGRVAPLLGRDAARFGEQVLLVHLAAEAYEALLAALPLSSPANLRYAFEVRVVSASRVAGAACAAVS